MARLICRTLDEIEPHARELGSDRERRIWNANRDIVEVVREIADAAEPSATPV